MDFLGPLKSSGVKMDKNGQNWLQMAIVALLLGGGSGAVVNTFDEDGQAVERLIHEMRRMTDRIEAKERDLSRQIEELEDKIDRRRCNQGGWR